MNPKSIVRLSNAIGLISIILLLYWVFAFTINEVFDLRVFRRNMTEIFLMSILGILALMFGALILNVMYNLTRIAQKLDNDQMQQATKNSKKYIISLLGLFPVIAAFLFIGNYLTIKKKETLLESTAKNLIDNNKQGVDKVLNYSFNKNWLKSTDDFLDIISKTDTDIPGIQIIVRDTIDGSTVFLGIRNYNQSESDTTPLRKKDFIFNCSSKDREYLNNIFDNKIKEPNFKGQRGNYELYYPAENNNKKVVFYFTDFQSYGKLGS